MSDTDTQFASPAHLLEEERGLQVDTIDELVCYRIGAFIADHAATNDLTVATAVFLGDRVVYKASLRGTDEGNDVVIDAKRRTALIGGHASLYERNRHLEYGTTFEEATGFSFPDYAPFGGAVPLKTASGDLVGMVVVSGLTQEEDHDLAVAAVRAASAR